MTSLLLLVAARSGSRKLDMDILSQLDMTRVCHTFNL
jgi:hypothetical protein